MAQNKSDKSKKRLMILLAAALCLCFISMVGTWAVQSNWGNASVRTYYVTTAELADMIEANNTQTGRSVQPTFTEDANARFSFMTMIPKTATAENPAPAVICIHGGANTKEMQMNGYVELVRRGFVVISIDMAEHGYTDAAINQLTAESYGGLAGYEYAISLPCVDPEKVGMTGHSMGNQACFFTILQANGEGYPNSRVAAWVEGAGTMYAPQMTAEMLEGMVWTISVDKFDEFDTAYFGAYDFLNGPIAGDIVRIAYPEFNGTQVEEGVYYTAAGALEAPNDGTRLEADSALCIVNPPITHPMFHFTTTGTAITINGFYNGLGTPAGVEYIPAEDQVWPVCAAFELLGLVGFFMLLFPLVGLLVRTRYFAAIRRPVTAVQDLGSAKDPGELAVWIGTVVVSVVFSFYSYIKLFPLGNTILDPSVYAVNDVPNGIGAWSLACGAFALLLIAAGYGVKKLLAQRSGVPVQSPFAVARLDNAGQFGRTVLFAAVILVVMFLPVYIARYLFNADFRICSFVVGAVSLKKLPLILCKYVPLWLAFYIPNAIMNANTRYRNIPEWISASVCALSNGIALVVFAFIQYSTLFRTGNLWNVSAGMAGIVSFAVIPCLFYAAFSARYIYKKTGNIWAAGLINDALMCFVTTFVTRYITDIVITF